MALAKGVAFNHVSRESSDIKRLAKFYTELFGFEQVESPKFEFDTIWLKLPTFFLHLIEKDPNSKLPEGPWSSTSAVSDVKHLRRGHHICFTVSNFDSFVHTLKDKGIEVGISSKYSSLIRMVMVWKCLEQVLINDAEPPSGTRRVFGRS